MNNKSVFTFVILQLLFCGLGFAYLGHHKRALLSFITLIASVLIFQTPIAGIIAFLYVTAVGCYLVEQINTGKASTDEWSFDI